MATREFDATIVFMAVAGEEQGLFGSTFFAEQAKQQGRNIAGMFTNDIVGSSDGDDGRRDPFSVRLFNEGVPTSETPEQAALRRSIGGENDGPSRQLARYIEEAGENRAHGMTVRLIFRRDRFLRGGDQIPFLERGYAAVRFTEPNEDFDHQHQDVRVENGVQFGDLIRFVDFDYTTRVARVNASALAAIALAPAAAQCPRPDRRAHECSGRTSTRTRAAARTMMIAEESTSFAGVTRQVEYGGLGFGVKWNMGSMNDSLRYLGREPIYRSTTTTR